MGDAAHATKNAQSLLLARVVPRTFSIKKQLNDKLHDRP